MVKDGIVFIITFFIFILCANSFAETLVHINQVPKEIANANHEEYASESQNQNSYEELKKEIKDNLIGLFSIVKVVVLGTLMIVSLILAMNKWNKIMRW